MKNFNLSEWALRHRSLVTYFMLVIVVAGIWSYFEAWLNILGVLVPPIGIILILDQLVFAAKRVGAGGGLYWKPLAAWAIGAAVALGTHFGAPELSDAVPAGGVQRTGPPVAPGVAPPSRTRASSHWSR